MFLLVGCSSSSDSNADSDFTSEFDYEVDVLYEHTLIMIDTTDSATLDEIGLRTEFIDRSVVDNSNEKLNQMVLAFNTSRKDSPEETLDHLNKVMLDMMDVWFEIEYN